MSEVVKLFPAKDPDVVLEEAKGCFSSVAVVGWDKDGELDVRVDLNMSIESAHLLMAIVQRFLENHMIGAD